MGLTYIEGQVKGPMGKEEAVKFLVDSGATYTLLPKKIWKIIGLESKRKMSFTLADGTSVARAISEAYITLPQGSAHTPVILGQKGDEALNPFNRTLHLSLLNKRCFMPRYEGMSHMSLTYTMACFFRFDMLSLLVEVKRTNRALCRYKMGTELHETVNPS